MAINAELHSFSLLCMKRHACNYWDHCYSVLMSSHLPANSIRHTVLHTVHSSVAYQLYVRQRSRWMSLVSANSRRAAHQSSTPIVSNTTKYTGTSYISKKISIRTWYGKPIALQIGETKQVPVLGIIHKERPPSGTGRGRYSHHVRRRIPDKYCRKRVSCHLPGIQ